MAIKSCGSDTHGVTVRDPSPLHCPIGLGSSLDLRWMEKVVGGGIEVDDQTVCCSALCTGVRRRKLSGESVSERTSGNYRLFSDWTAADNARVDVAMFSSDLCTLGFYF